MKKRLTKKTLRRISVVLIIMQIFGWIGFAFTFLDDMNWPSDECVCGGELTYEYTIGNGVRLYECEDCGRNFRLVNKYER